MASLRNHSEVERAGLSGFPDYPGGHPFRESLALVEDYLEGLGFSQDPQFAGLTGAMRHALSNGGERVRAVLCLEVARSFGLDPVSVLPSAAAVELIHTASLVHDDLLCPNGSRPGKMPPWDEELDDATAILAGDALFSESVALISSRQKGTPRQLLDIVGELAAVTGVGGMMGGQALSIADRDGREADPETLEAMHAYRTGALIEASARIGAILAGASETEKENISEYARKLGLCLRITSDIPTAADSEKDPSGRDSFVGVYGLPEARRLASEALREALEVLERLDADTRSLAEMVRFVNFRKTTSVT